MPCGETLHFYWTLTQNGKRMVNIRRILPGEGLLYRQIRLSALAESPRAFCSTLADAEARSVESWHVQANGTADGPERATFLAFHDATPVGLAACYRDATRNGVAEVLQVWVHPTWRGAGVGWRLMDVVVHWAAANGYTTLVAEVRSGNARALDFYQRYGFHAEAPTQLAPDSTNRLEIAVG